MKFGLHMPDAIETGTLVELAIEAERAGWDGFFYWDCDTYDAWIALTAVALSTRQLCLATIVTPLPRRNPYVVARQAAALDHLSQGRFILPVGLGVAEHEQWNLTSDYKTRAQMIDEELAILDKWWSGDQFSYAGKYYQAHKVTGRKPLQTPRVPLWVVGGLKQTQLRRAARWDGVITHGTPAEVQALLSSINNLRTSSNPLDCAVQGETSGTDKLQATSMIQSYADVGVTWWLEGVWDSVFAQDGVEGIRQRIRQGPPCLS